MKKIIWILAGFLSMTGLAAAESNEVIPDASTQVAVRKNPKTGMPFVSIVDRYHPDARKIFPDHVKTYARPQYDWLKPDKSADQIPYDGPSSNRTKVYMLAASLAAGGAAAGTLLPVTAAAAGSGAGAGVLTGAGAAVAAGTAAGAYTLTKSDPRQDEFKHESTATLKEVSDKR